MATGKSGYFDLTGSVSSFTLRVNWAESYDVESNKSTVKITSVQVHSGSYSGYTYYLDGVVKVNGTVIFSMDSTVGDYAVTVNGTGSWYSVKKSGATATGSVDIPHDTDGSKTIRIEVAGKNWQGCRFYTVAGGSAGGSGWRAEGYKDVALTTIPRASTIGATDANIGATSMIAITKKASAYTHSIRYSFGKLSGYITRSGGISASEVKLSERSIAWSVPTSFYAQIPTAKSGKCTLTCTTYSGATKIGDAQTCEITLTAAESACAPDVSGTMVDSNAKTIALTGSEGKLIRYHSTALCTIAASAKNSASITAKQIGSVVLESGNTRSVYNVESGGITFYATDSRGYTASARVELPLVPYIKLTNNAVAFRSDPTSGAAVLRFSGAYYNGSFGSKSNSLTLKYKIGSGAEHTVTPTISGNSYSAEVALTDMDYTKSYSVTVTAADALETVAKTVPLLQGIPVFDWGANDFVFNKPAYMGDSLLMTRADAQTGWFNPGKVSAHSYVDYELTFAKAFRKTPRVVPGIYSNTQSYNYHYLALVVLTQSAEGFTLRIFNASDVELSPTINWLAMVEPDAVADVGTGGVTGGGGGVQGPQGPQGPKGDKGDKGDPGEDGATFTPSVSADGTLSWTNDKGLENPAPVSIKGPKGDPGSGGTSGGGGLYAFAINESGNLILTYSGDTPPDFSVDDSGHLIANF